MTMPLDLVLVRQGATPLEQKGELRVWVSDLVECFRRG